MKRGFDLTVALLLLLLLWPLILLVALLIAWRLGSPVVFAQQRPGQYGRPFVIYKFRTMTSTTDTHGQLLSDAERLTPLGKMIRKLSLDELPQLFNVLKGELSLVGPRPLLMEYLPLYSPEQARRHEVKPGITGWAQVNGRNAISWEDKFRYDVWYVDHQSFWLDIKILGLTVLKVVRSEGVSQVGHATMEKFTGSRK
jgi:sugar transferase EpsL